MEAIDWNERLKQADEEIDAIEYAKHVLLSEGVEVFLQTSAHLTVKTTIDADADSPTLIQLLDDLDKKVKDDFGQELMLRKARMKQEAIDWNERLKQADEEIDAIENAKHVLLSEGVEVFLQTSAHLTVKTTIDADADSPRLIQLLDDLDKKVKGDFGQELMLR